MHNGAIYVYVSETFLVILKIFIFIHVHVIESYKIDKYTKYESVVSMFGWNLDKNYKSLLYARNNWYQGSQLSPFRENESRYGHTPAMK